MLVRFNYMCFEAFISSLNLHAIHSLSPDTACQRASNLGFISSKSEEFSMPKYFPCKMYIQLFKTFRLLYIVLLVFMITKYKVVEVNASPSWNIIKKFLSLFFERTLFLLKLLLWNVRTCKRQFDLLTVSNMLFSGNPSLQP